MTNVILIHGAWHWAGCWEKVSPFLHEKQVNVFAPDLEVNKSTTLTDHVNQILDLINQNALKDVILVGHSYAGLVIAGVLSEVPNKIRHTIFLDAILPEKGIIPFRYYFSAISVYLFWVFAAIFPLLKPLSQAEGFGITDVETIKMVNDNLRKHPLKTMLQVFKFTPQYHKEKCTYVRCTEIVAVGKKKGGKQKNHLEQFYL